jgi:hypothetical protein
MIAGAAKLAAAAPPTMVFTNDRREVELPEDAIFLLLGSYGVVTFNATDMKIKS